MGVGRGRARGHVLLSRGSATIEGIASIAIGFLLLAAVIQVVAVISTQHRVEAIVMTAAEEAAAVGGAPDEAEAWLRSTIADVIGSGAIESSVTRTATEVTARARVRVIPPGPHLFPIHVGARVTLARIVEP